MRRRARFHRTKVFKCNKFFPGQKTHDHQIAVSRPVLDVENNATIFSSRNGTVFEINGTRFPKCYLSTFLRKMTIFCILGGSKKGVSGSRRNYPIKWSSVIVLDTKTKVRPKNPKFSKCYLSTFVRKRQNCSFNSNFTFN